MLYITSLCYTYRRHIANGETYEEFVNRMIDLKKAIIARAIGASPELQKAHQMLYDRRRPVKVKVVS
jgi:hypothetical protein